MFPPLVAGVFAPPFFGGEPGSRISEDSLHHSSSCSLETLGEVRVPCAQLGSSPPRLYRTACRSSRRERWWMMRSTTPSYSPPALASFSVEVRRTPMIRWRMPSDATQMKKRSTMSTHEPRYSFDSARAMKPPLWVAISSIVTMDFTMPPNHTSSSSLSPHLGEVLAISYMNSPKM